LFKIVVLISIFDSVIVSITFCRRCFLNGKPWSIKFFFKSSERDSIYLNNLELIIYCLLLLSIKSLIIFCTLMKSSWHDVPANHLYTVPKSFIHLFDLVHINCDRDNSITSRSFFLYPSWPLIRIHFYIIWFYIYYFLIRT